MGIGGQGSILLPAHALGWVTRAGFGIDTHLHLSDSGLLWEDFASMDGLPVMLCVIHTVRYALSTNAARAELHPTPLDIDARQRVTLPARRVPQWRTDDEGGAHSLAARR